MGILAQYGEIAPASLDEAYCSLTAYCAKENVTPSEAASRIRAQVEKETGCTVSAGVSPNAMLSKIAADLRKPNGQSIVDPSPQACIDFMRDLSVRKIPGIGRVSEQWLQAIGVQKVSDIYRLRGKLYLVRHEIGLTFLLRSYLGLGTTVIKSRERGQRKSVSAESTFGNVTTLTDIFEKLRGIAETLAGDLASSKYSGRTITLKMKLATYEVLTRAKTLGKNTYVSDVETLYREGKKLIEAEIAQRRKAIARGGKVKGGKAELTLRLLGLKMSNLRDDTDDRKSAKQLNAWTGASEIKKSDSPSPRKSIKAEDDLEEEDEDSLIAAATGDDGDLELLKLEGADDEDMEMLQTMTQKENDPSFWQDGDGAQVDSKDVNEPPSSDPLWASVGGAVWDDGEEVVEPTVARGKPFFTVGDALNSKVEMAAPSAPEDQLQFRSIARVCPVCDRTFVASETAFSGHVDSHFPPDVKSSKGVSKASNKRSASSQGRLDDVKRPKTPYTLDGFLKAPTTKTFRPAKNNRR